MLGHGLIKHLPGSLINGGHRLEVNSGRPGRRRHGRRRKGRRRERKTGGVGVTEEGGEGKGYRKEGGGGLVRGKEE